MWNTSKARPLRSWPALFGFVALVSGIPSGMAYALHPAQSPAQSYVSFSDRGVTVAASAYGGRTVPAQLNQPLGPGDRLLTPTGRRGEVMLADGSMLWLDGGSRVELVALANTLGRDENDTQLDFAAGRLAVQVAPGPDLRIDLPLATVYLDAGRYRIDSLGGRVAVLAFDGQAEVRTRQTSDIVVEGEALEIDGLRSPSVVAIARYGTEPFDRWVNERLSRYRTRPESARYVSARLASSSPALDRYGDWRYIDDYGAHGWCPEVSAGWRPYSSGSWYTTAAGLSWVSSEPWGWATYHYGSWTWSSRYGWVWFPDERYTPASVYWYYDADYVGWAPAGYYDYYYRNAYRQSNAVSFSIGFHNDWSGSRFDLARIDARPWAFVRFDDFDRLAPSVDVAGMLVPWATVRSTVTARPRFGTVIAEPLLVRPATIGSPRDLAAAFRFGSGRYDLTPVFARDARRLPVAARTAVIAGDPLEATLAQQRRRGVRFDLPGEERRALRRSSPAHAWRKGPPAGERGRSTIVAQAHARRRGETASRAKWNNRSPVAEARARGPKRELPTTIGDRSPRRDERPQHSSVTTRRDKGAKGSERPAATVRRDKGRDKGKERSAITARQPERPGYRKASGSPKDTGTVAVKRSSDRPARPVVKPGSGGRGAAARQRPEKQRAAGQQQPEKERRGGGKRGRG